MGYGNSTRRPAGRTYLRYDRCSAHSVQGVQPLPESMHRYSVSCSLDVARGATIGPHRWGQHMHSMVLFTVC